MKVILGAILLASAVFAEPPLYRQQQRQFYFARQQEDPTAAAPYPGRGWRPAGPAFDLPQRQVQAEPQQQYGAPQAVAPQQQYGAPQAVAPQQQYGIPEQQYGAPEVPQQQYGAPQQQFGTPQQQYKRPAPQRQSAAPQQQYGAPEQQYGAPEAPQQQYGAPQQQYKRPAPQRQSAAPQQQYGAPQQPQYYPNTNPQKQYGAPQLERATTTETPSSTEFDDETTVPNSTEAESEPVNSVNELEDEEVDEQGENRQSGEYYVALPDGRLQKVTYVSRQDLEAMKYFAKVRAENVEPLRGPIYAYTPLQKLQILPAGLQLAVSPAVPQEPAKAEKLSAESPKLQVQPVAAQVQYQLDNPASVVPLSTPVSSSYTTYTANYQVPAGDSRFLLTIQ